MWANATAGLPAFPPPDDTASLAPASCIQIQALPEFQRGSIREGLSMVLLSHVTGNLTVGVFAACTMTSPVSRVAISIDLGSPGSRSTKLSE